MGQLIPAPEAVLHDVAPALGSSLEELHRVRRVRDLAEHEHADLRMRLPELGRNLDAFVRAGRRHADVGHDDVGLVLLHGPAERVQILALLDDVDVVLVLEDPRDALAGQVAVIRDQDADGHGRRSRSRLPDAPSGASPISPL
jgi:hypothetical protein